MPVVDWINCIIRIIFYVFIIGTLFGLLRTVFKVNRFSRELKSTKRLKGLPDAGTVLGKVIDIHEEQLTNWDRLYTVNVVYTVEETVFTQSFTFLNRASLRTGAEIKLIYDKSEPQNAVVEDGSQADVIRIFKRRIIRSVLLLLFLILGVYLFFRFGIEDWELDD